MLKGLGIGLIILMLGILNPLYASAGFLPGDKDGDSKTTVEEVQTCINQFLEIDEPGPYNDINSDGRVTIDELQKVINVFLGRLIFYPDTDSAPVLRFQWDEELFGPLNLSTDSSGHIYSCGPFGVEEEGGFLNQEMAIFFAHRTREPIYAPSDGVITYLVEYDNFEDAMQPGKGGEIWIRYGKNFAVAYRHIVTTGLNLMEGQIVKKEEIVGYTVDMDVGDDDPGSFWEMLVAEKRGEKDFYYRNPFNLFDSESQDELLDIWNAARRKNMPGYQDVNNPWGDIDEFQSEGGNAEIPYKMGYLE